MNRRECVQRLRIYASTLHDGGLVQTAQQLLAWASKIDAGDCARLAIEYKASLGQFRQESTQKDMKLAKLYDALEAYIKAKMKTVNPSDLLRMDLMLRETIQSQQAVSQLTESFKSDKLSIEQRFYGLCFIYLLMLEGIHDDAMRYLLAWSGHPIERVLDMNVGTVESELLKQGADPVLFEGRERRIRNSIAHARFSFDATRSRAIFDDVNPRDPNDKFHREMAYGKFVDLVTAAYSFLFLLQVLLIMMIDVPVVLLEAKKS